jgi:hypothetical protein
MRRGLVGSKIVLMLKSKLSQPFRIFSSRRMILSRQALIEYFIGFLGLYRNAPKSEKTALLTQAQIITGKSRRTIARYLAKSPEKLAVAIKIEGRGRQPLYRLDLILPHVRVLWKNMERISSARMIAAIPMWLSHYRDPSCTAEVREKLLAMSRCTLERMLGILRRENTPKKGLSTTIPAAARLKSKIPISTLDKSATRPGFTQADTVAHCGNAIAGSYIHSLTVTDLFSGWTENRAFLGKKAIEVKRAFIDIKRSLPFSLIAVNTDSGTEFINEDLFNWMLDPNPNYREKSKIIFTRSRPYKKNDNCYVEQKNYTHVRQLFGYYRLEDQALASLMNHIYSEIWNPMNNYFLPSQKLIEKTRVGSKIVKRHDDPKTPAQRLLDSKTLSEEQIAFIKTKQQTLNPFELSKQLELKLQEFFDLYRQSIILKEAA